MSVTEPRPASRMLPDAPPVVSLRGVTKRFGKVVANQSIDLDIRPGRIKALLGENGAGKSTLMSMLAGRFPPDEGEILVDGRPVRFASSKAAIAAGVGMVYQHFMLVETMSVAQNVLLGQEGGFLVRPKDMEARVGELAKKYGLEIDPSARVSGLSMGERQRVEILKLLTRESRVLIFDEPTAVLTPRETFRLFEALWTMARQGKAIVFISHKLEEVMAVADEVAILRRGRVECDFPAGDAPTKSELACRMVGREVLLEVDRAPVPPGGEVLRIEGLTGLGLSDIHLSVRRGEVMAVVGVAGNGQMALVEAVCGLRRPPKGSIRILDRPWSEFYADMPWTRSLAWIPEDRLGLATARNLDLVDNLLLTTRQGFSRGPWLDRGRAEKVMAGLAATHDIRPGDIRALAWQLSGGNLQKMVLARELYRDPRLIVAEQPTQGLDVSATEEVWNRLLAARASAGILLVTGDLNEALQLSDRIAVIYRGHLMDTFPATDTAKIDRIGLMMAGVRE